MTLFDCCVRPVSDGVLAPRAIWNVGHVRRSGHIFLLVTLDKQGHAETFKYRDQFLDAEIFQWQSQNRTSKASADGQEIRLHGEGNVPVLLFDRAEKKMSGGGAAPFVDCGDVTFVNWEGDRPITVRCRLLEPVLGRLRHELSVPDPSE